MPEPEFNRDEALKLLVEGDLFTYKQPVIPIKTKGRWYGSISRHVAETGFKIPDVPLGSARLHEPYVFLALWSDASAYTADLMSTCGKSCIALAARLKFDLLAMPVLGGKEGMKWLWAVEKGIFEMTDELDEQDIAVPPHIYLNLGPRQLPPPGKDMPR